MLLTTESWFLPYNGLHHGVSVHIHHYALFSSIPPSLAAPLLFSCFLLLLHWVPSSSFLVLSVSITFCFLPPLSWSRGRVLTELPHSSKQDVQSPNPGSPLRQGSLMVILALLKIEIENELPSLNVFKKIPPLPASVKSWILSYDAHMHILVSVLSIYA